MSVQNDYLKVNVSLNNMISLEFHINGKVEKYHVTTISETKHITEDHSRTHYGYETEFSKDANAWIIRDQQMSQKEKGSRKNCTVFSSLPDYVQKFFSKHYGEILAMKAGEEKTFEN